VAQGDQAKSLIIISKNKGFDPTVIPARTGPGGKSYKEENISNFDKAPDINNRAGTGKLPPAKPDQKILKFEDEPTWNRPKGRK
jgi:hypothetical protein